MNIYQLKINSVHLSSAKLICSNSWVLVLSFSIDFEKVLLGLFPYRPYVYHKNDSTYLTQKI